MRLLVLTLFILSFSSFARFEAPPTLTDFLSPQEMKMQECINKINKADEQFLTKANKCLKGSNYYQQRMPSAVNMQMNQMIVSQYSWFFDSDDYRIGFISFIKKLNKARDKANKIFNKFTHGQGVGAFGSAYFGVGLNWLAEVVVHKGKVALFCAPGISVQPSVGASIGLMGLKTLGCNHNNHYTGGFLTAAGGFNTTAAGLPFSLELSYSLGIDLVQFFKDIKNAHNYKSINFSELAYELKTISDLANKNLFKAETLALPLYFGVRSTQYLNKLLKNKTDYEREFVAKELPIKAKSLKNKIWKNRSLGRIIKNGINSLNPIFDQYNLVNSKKFFRILQDNISGCDAIGGSAAISPTLSAGVLLSGSLSYYDYSLLFELPEMKLLSWRSLSPFTLLNPFLMDTEDLQDIANAAKKIVFLSSTIKRQCSHTGKIYQLMR